MKKPVEYYDPKTNKYPYSEYTDEHYLKVKKDSGVVFDNNYPYIDKRWFIRVLDFLVRVLLYLVIFLMVRVRLGLRIKGKENLKRNKKVIKQGVISTCNHVHMWDFLGILCAIKPIRPRILVWDKNIRGENGALIRRVGGIPLPTDNPKGMVTCFKVVDDFLSHGGWLHIYPEQAMWEFYAPIRPFKRGFSYIAIQNNKPVIPFAYSYRRPGWIRRKIFHQFALLTLNIGEPIYPNNDLMGKDRENDLTTRVHDAMVKLAGRDPGNKIYPAIFDNSKRVDYYTTEYGINYKGSK